MKVIAVSQRVDTFASRNETRDAVDQKLIQFLSTAGYFPAPVPNGLFQHKSANYPDCVEIGGWLAAIKPAGFVLSGGNDIGQNKERDIVEGKLLNYAELNHLPVLGICRGMLMMAHRHGADLQAVQNHVNKRHIVRGEINDVVNSYHKFALLDCPNQFRTIAKSEDGYIEAIRHQELAWEGWMWHPERENEFKDNDIKRLRLLLS